jgi:hypothetical protein
MVMDRADDVDVPAPSQPPPRFALRAMHILWPSFLMAGVLEAMVFAVVDPGELHWFGGPAIEWSRQAVYSVTFAIFWWVISLAGALSALLAAEPPEGSRVAVRQRWP